MEDPGINIPDPQHWFSLEGSEHLTFEFMNNKASKTCKTHPGTHRKAIKIFIT
jgi:hypothetical protein